MKNEYVHGGDVYRNRVSLDFSVNLNPLGMPDEVRKAAIEGVMASEKYPDYYCSELREALSRTAGVNKDCLLFGNGAAELIFQLCQVRKPKKALLIAPTFAEYEQALLAAGSRIDYHMLLKEDGFCLTQSYLAKLEEGYDMAILCNPNNPTGEVIGKDMLSSILGICKKNGTFLMIDECFMDFLKPCNQTSCMELVKTCGNIGILKAFTKMYSMAGLRLGYLYTSNEEVLSGIPKISQPWNVSIPSQYAGVAAVWLDGFVNRTQEFLEEERTFLADGLEKIGAKVYGSRANYIFFQYKEELDAYLLGHGILIRSCGNYRGLDGSYYRICVRSHTDNTKLLEYIKLF